MKKFEYKILNFRTTGMVNLLLTKEDEHKMNALGEEGWELISLHNTKTARTIMAVFKRQKNNE